MKRIRPKIQLDSNEDNNTNNDLNNQNTKSNSNQNDNNKINTNNTLIGNSVGDNDNQNNLLTKEIQSPFKSRTYPKVGQTLVYTTPGIHYQAMILLNEALDLTLNNKNFELKTETSQVEKFDDFILDLENCVVYRQIKYSNKPNEYCVNDFAPKKVIHTNTKVAFCAYFDDWMNIPESCTKQSRFQLFSNSKLPVILDPIFDDQKKRFTDHFIDGKTKCPIPRSKLDFRERIFKHIKSHSKHKKEDMGDNKQIELEFEEKIKDFLRIFELHLGESDLISYKENLGKILENELVQYSSTIEELLFYHFCDWISAKKGRSITDESFQETLNTIYSKCISNQRLLGESKNCLRNIKNKIGDYQIPREGLLQKIEESLKHSSAIVISGEKGVGKSGLMKMFVEKKETAKPILVLKAEEFKKSSLCNVSYFKQFDQKPETIVANFRELKLVCLDGIEKVVGCQNQGTIIKFFEILKNAKIPLLMTCTQEEIETLKKNLPQKKKITIIKVPLITKKLLMKTFNKELKRVTESSTIIRICQSPFFLNMLIHLIGHIEISNIPKSKHQYKIKKFLIVKTIEGKDESLHSQRVQAWKRISILKSRQEDKTYIKPTRIPKRVLESLKQEGIVITNSKNEVNFEHDLFMEHGIYSYLETKMDLVLEDKTDDFFRYYYKNSYSFRKLFEKWLRINLEYLTSWLNKKELMEHHGILLATSIEADNLKTAQIIINIGKIDLDEIINYGFANENYRYLCLAVDRRKFKIVELLLKNGANPNSEIRLYTPLHISCMDYGSNKLDLELTKLLLDHGADPNILNNHKQSPLHFAAIEGKLDLLELLLRKNANPNLRNGQNELPIECIRKYYRHENDFKIYKLLLAKTNLETIDKLILSIRLEDIETIKQLISNKADINKQNHLGFTPLNVACTTCNLDIVNILIDNGANLELVDKYYCTALFIACGVEGSSNLKVITRLLDAGIHPDSSGIEETPLFRAIFTKKYEIVKLLLKRGADPNKKDDMDLTPILHITGWSQLRERELKLIKLLIDYETDLTIQDEYVGNALHKAVERGHLNAVKVLIEYGKADPLLISNPKKINAYEMSCGDIQEYLYEYKKKQKQSLKKRKN
ncbi:ankyrin repeat and protein kinase domain-containing protein [Anaeramoeba flamelloides]|uniref:Ankyrin repeat and protein kinase domain-containing protein n=1 Tax=Anaeramoeba flamelloides TaxID=1746091 RepID=A0ABQ8YVJ1_9EUKA|nr:ankyrin repeat and protein kinase domain-containing protein [Anaeramoeba flamelloides]